jgi:hypothetical protein
MLEATRSQRHRGEAGAGRSSGERARDRPNTRSQSGAAALPASRGGSHAARARMRSHGTAVPLPLYVSLPPPAQQAAPVAGMEGSQRQHHICLMIHLIICPAQQPSPASLFVYTESRSHHPHTSLPFAVSLLGPAHVCPSSFRLLDGVHEAARRGADDDGRRGPRERECVEPCRGRAAWGSPWMGAIRNEIRNGSGWRPGR